MTAVAVLGTGTMGEPMARNLLRHGHQVAVWNRSPERARPLAEAGARLATDPGDAVRDCDVLLTALTDGDTVAEVIRAAGPQLPRGAVWAQVSTVGVAATEALADLADEHGLEFVDAPVLGSRIPAERAELLVLAAGPEHVRERVAPVFDAIGRGTRWLGDTGRGAGGSRLKLVVNSWVLAVTAATGEAFALAEALGADPRNFLGAIAGGPLDCQYAQLKGRAISDGDYTPAFTVRNAAKDAGLIAEAGRDTGVRLDVAEAAGARLRRADQQGHGEQDMVAAYFASWPNR